MSIYKQQKLNASSEALVPLSDEGFPEVKANNLFEAYGKLTNFDCGDYFSGDQVLLTVLQVGDVESGVPDDEALLVEYICDGKTSARSLIFKTETCGDAIDYFVELVITGIG